MCEAMSSSSEVLKCNVCKTEVCESMQYFAQVVHIDVVQGIAGRQSPDQCFVTLATNGRHSDCTHQSSLYPFLATATTTKEFFFLNAA